MRVIQFDPVGAVRDLRFRPDGRELAGLLRGPEGDKGVAWWDLARDAPARRLPAAGATPWGHAGVAVSPDLRLVARGLCELADGEWGMQLIEAAADPPRCHEVPCRGRIFRCFGFSPDGRALGAGAGDENIDETVLVRWSVDDLLTGRDDWGESVRVSEIPYHDPGATCVAWSPTVRRVVVGGSHELFTVVTLPGRGIVRPTRVPVRAAPVSARFSPDGRRLLVLRSGEVLVFETRRWKVVAELADPAGVTDAAYSPDGRTLATARRDGSVAFRDAAALAETGRFAWGVGTLHSVAFAPDGLTCAAGAEGGRVVLWDVGG